MSVNYQDPFSVWKSFYDEVEPLVSQSLQKILESEEYAAASGQLLNATLQMEQYYAKTVERLLRNYKLPSVKDFARLGELMVGLESKIDAIDERLLRLERQMAQNEEVREQLAILSGHLDAISRMLPVPEMAGLPEETPNRRRRQRASKNGGDANQAKSK